MATSFRASACVAAALTLALTACTDNSSNTSSAPSTTAVTSSAPAPSASSSTPAATPTAVPPSTPAARTAAQLTKALLALADLPAGFSIEKDDSGDDSDVTVSSKDSRCAKLVALTNAETPPGSKASAGQSYSGGAEGPFIDETLDAMGSATAVAALQRSFKKAITDCRTMTLKIPGEGSSPIAVREVSAPQAGTNPVAVRFSATAGPLEGLEVTVVTAGINDVILGITVVAGLPEDIDGATTAAVDKAEATLGVKSSGT